MKWKETGTDEETHTHTHTRTCAPQILVFTISGSSLAKGGAQSPKHLLQCEEIPKGMPFLPPHASHTTSCRSVTNSISKCLLDCKARQCVESHRKATERKEPELGLPERKAAPP